MTAKRRPRPTNFARTYARLAPEMDARGAGQHRAELVADLSGTVLDVGCGPGGTFRHYPRQVRRVIGVEPDPYLRGVALETAMRLNRETAARRPDGDDAAERIDTAERITVVPGRADALPAEDNSVDAVVFSLVLCSVPDVAAALAEARRVLKPAGTVRFYEHVRSRSRIVAAVEDVITPLWRRLAGGCHPNRDTANLIRAAGFTIGQMRRFGFASTAGSPRIAHILGSAHPDERAPISALPD